MPAFDLNLVRTFVLLYETRSVTATAEAMHLTQPTVSYSLTKLRRRFDDDLFRRTRDGMVPTVLAQQLYVPLSAALAELDSAVSTVSDFDPATATTRFTIALSDLGELALLPRIVAALREAAPGVSLGVRALDLVDAENLLARGEIDCFVASPVLESARLTRTRLFTEGHVALVAANHPRVKGPKSLQRRFAAERFVVLASPAGHLGPKIELARAVGSSSVAVEVSRCSSIAEIVESSELVAILPRYAAEVLAQRYAIRLLPVPVEIPDVQVALYTRHRRGQSRAERWLTKLIATTITTRD